MKPITHITHLLFVLILLQSCEKEKNIVRDADGNEYHTVTIGTQVWMATNLLTTKYANGESIADGIYVPNDNSNNVGIYGRLYTWFVATNTRSVCPTGWHVPSESDWNTLLSNVTSPADLKESGYSHWLAPNTLATNSVLFTALPGGYYSGSEFLGINETAAFWFMDEVNISTAKGYRLYFDNSPTTGDLVHANKDNAFSIRCVKD